MDKTWLMNETFLIKKHPQEEFESSKKKVESSRVQVRNKRESPLRCCSERRFVTEGKKLGKTAQTQTNKIQHQDKCWEIFLCLFSKIMCEDLTPLLPAAHNKFSGFFLPLPLFFPPSLLSVFTLC